MTVELVFTTRVHKAKELRRGVGECVVGTITIRSDILTPDIGRKVTVTIRRR